MLRIGLEHIDEIMSESAVFVARVDSGHVYVAMSCMYMYCYGQGCTLGGYIDFDASRY